MASKNSSMAIIWWALFAAGALFIFPGMVLLIICGLIPGIVAYLIDRSPKKYATFCVGGMNLAGICPAALKLWNGDNNVAQAFAILTSPFELIIMFAAASFGWLIYFFVPPIVVALLTVIAQHRVAQLREEQKALIKDWGDGVAVGPEAMDLAHAGNAATYAAPLADDSEAQGDMDSEQSGENAPTEAEGEAESPAEPESETDKATAA
jgi:hypothetical protein